MNDYRKILPVGTVVLLKGAVKKVMIIGYQRTHESDPDRIYDYCGAPYPEGYISPAKTAVFDHDMIDRIYSMGYQNEVEIASTLRTGA